MEPMDGNAIAGQLVEVFRDRALALPPLTHTLARRLMDTNPNTRAQYLLALSLRHGPSRVQAFLKVF